MKPANPQSAGALPRDKRSAQCERAALFLELHPDSTGMELKAGADLGCERKVISVMRREYGYEIRAVKKIGRAHV